MSSIDQDTLAPGCSPYPPQTVDKEGFKPCLGPGYFPLPLKDDLHALGRVDYNFLGVQLQSRKLQS